MENFHAAFFRCVKDVEVLHEQRRRIAAMHFGGVAIECLLKHILVSSFPRGAIRRWYDRNDRRTWGYGHTIENPKHEYNLVLLQHSILQSRVAEAGVQRLLDDVKKPDGYLFIHMRYSSREPQAEKYNAWWKKYDDLKDWLQIQTSTL